MVLEDFTTYTAVDGGGDLTVTAPKVAWASMIRNVSDYVYKDYGAGFFGDFEIQFTVNLSDVEAGDASNSGIAAVCTVANSFGTLADIIGGDVIYCAVNENAAVDDQFYFRFLQYTGGVQDFDATGAPRGIGTFYCTFTRFGTTVTLRIYDNPARGPGDLLETLTDGGSGDNTAYRYVHALQSWDSVSDPNNESTGYVEDLDLGFTEELLGEFTSRQASSQELLGYFKTLRNDAPKELLGYFDVRRDASQELLGIFTSQQITDQEELKATFDVNQTNASQELLGEFIVRNSTEQDLLARFDGQVSLNLLGELIVRQAASQDLTSGFHVNYWYNISHLVINTGSIVGSTDDTWVDDGAKLELNETVGGPAFDYELHFKNVPANQVFGIRMNGYYDGNLAHVKKLYEWNFDTVGWDAVTAVADDLPDAVADQDYAWMGGGPDYVSGGEYRLQIVHPAAGNINHDLFIDLLWLDVEFSVDEELLGVLTSRQTGSVDHLGHFIVRQPASQDLKASFDGQVSLNLPAEFSARRSTQWDLAAVFISSQSSTELFAEFEVTQLVSQDLLGIINVIQFLDLLARFEVQDVGSAELLAGFEIRHPASVELFAEFEVGRGGSVELLSKFLMRVSSDTNRIIIAVDPNSWINYGLGVGTGFLDGPYLGPDRNNRVYGGSSLMFLSEYLKNRFDYLKFGWRKDSEFTSSVWMTNLCVEDVQWIERISEDWDWDEQTIITNILRDTYTKIEFWFPGGNAGWTHAGTNYGASTALKCSRFYSTLPGTSDLELDDEETFIKFSLSGLSAASLSRLAWARVELYRYAGGANDINRISARRIAECWETAASYTFWNPANTLGTCVNVAGPHYPPSNDWDETTLVWVNSGRYALTMGGGQPYMGLPSFTKTSPTVRYGLTADNNEWDMVRITDLLEGWLEGTYGNQGLALLSETVDGGDSSGEFGGGASFYSSRAGSANKPRLRLQYIPAASEDLWSFESPDRWQINLANPYKGTGALHLIDWSKVSYDESRTNQASVTLTSDYPFSEGAIDTFFRINNATYPRVTYGGPNKWVSHTTPRTNFFNIYIRYQDSDNYYRVQLLPTGSNSTILRRQGGGNTTLQTFDSGIPAGAGWARIRVFWAVDGKGILHICCFRYDTSRANWRVMGSTEDANNYWSDGGDITFESYDAEIDETRISERLQ